MAQRRERLREGKALPVDPSELLRLLGDLSPEELRSLLDLAEAARDAGNPPRVEVTDAVGLTDTIVVAVTLAASGEVQQPTIQVTSELASSWNVQAPRKTAVVWSKLQSMSVQDWTALARLISAALNIANKL
jgi:hypothetical protein